MSMNVEWHSKHKLPEHPTIDRSVRWHIEHARNCPCPSSDMEILEEVKKKYLNTHQEFWIYFNISDHLNLAIWAADCADHVLPFFDKKYPNDARPREAIRTLREWVISREFSMPVIRGASLAAHAAAREVVREDNSARFAARAAGQAVATAHVPSHAFGAALYAMKAVAADHPADVNAAMHAEREWQSRRLPDNLRDWVISELKQTERLLPKDIRK